MQQDSAYIYDQVLCQVQRREEKRERERNQDIVPGVGYGSRSGIVQSVEKRHASAQLVLLWRTLKLI